MLQKKFEKLPGLSNVSGKYTKKTTADVFSRPSVLDNRSTTTNFQGLSAQESPTASTSVFKFEPDERHRYRFGPTAVPSSCSVPQLKDTVNRQVDRRRSHIQVLSTRQSSTDVSSPSWPSSLSSVSNDRQFPSSNLPTRTSENLRRVKKASEIVKSSSSGSVASLTHKPTGIILGTSSTVHGSETTGSLSNTHATVSRPHAPSTPYPVRQFCMSSANRDGVGPSSAASSPLHHSFEKPAENTDSSDASTNAMEPIRCTRPSVLVRPMNMPVQVSASIGVACPPDATSSYAGISFDRNARVPWKRHVYADSETRRRVCSPSSSQVVTSQLHGPRSTHNELNSVVGDRIQSTGLVSSRSVSGVPWLFSTTSALGAYQGQDSRINNDINSDGDHTSVSSSWSNTSHRSGGPACPQCRFSAAPQSLFCSHFCELQPPHPPWGSAAGGHPDGVAMPGPQYTQCALQQYLSDLIAGESSLLGESTKFGDRDDNSLDKNSAVIGVPFFDSMSNSSDYQGLELLRCLENRIQNALRNLYNSGVPVGIFENANLSARGSRGRSISFSSGSQRYVFPSGATTMPSLVTSPAYDSPIPEKSSQPGSSLTGARAQVSSQLSQELTDRRSMLDQFSENELRYLLKAVHDLLALRSQTCGTPGSSSPSPVILQHHPKPTPPKTDREDTPADGSYRHVSQECLLDSQATSRSSTTVRSSCIRALKSGVDRPPSSSDAIAACTPGLEYDSSSSDLMHKRLPLGFQHFKRYLDNKFGPDQPHPLSPGFSIRATTSGSGHVAEATIGVRGATASVEQPIPLHTSHSTSTNSIATGEVQPRPPNAEPSVTNCRPQTGSDAVNHVTQSTDGLVSSRGSLGEAHRPATCRNAPCLDSPISTTEHSRSKAPLAMPDNVDHPCQLAAVELGHDSTEVHAFPTSPYIAPITPVNVNSCGTAPVLQYYEERDYPPPQQFDLSPPLVPHTPYLPFHQRSCGSNPEVTETHASNFPVDYSARSRWSPYMPQCYWWPHPAADHSPHNSWLGQFMQEQLNMTMPQFPTPSQETCSCGIEFHQMYPYTHWHRPQLSALSSGSALRAYENTRFAAYADSARVMPSSSTAMQLNSVLAFPSGQSVDATYGGGYGFPDSAQMATAQWEYPSYVDRTPLMHHGLPRAFYPLSPSPTFDSAMWNPPVAWSSRLPYCHTPFSPYHFRMPRSGSAGAGFGCSLDGSSNPTGLMSQRMTRERSVGPDLNGLQPPIPRSAHRCLGPMYHAPPTLPMGRGSSDLSPPAKDSPNVTPSGVRTMSNSLSANDLSGYRSKHPFEMRSTKSSFELSPELPCDPALTLTNFTDFYSKIAAFIEMDNSLQITVPSGWSERRSSFGRCYYACDQTKQASWNHPTLGLYVPLGWERVDSCHDGIFYRNLLIPHCQRHHPNLWLPAPMKDPAIEREGFFSDLRHLQSSVRHEIKFEFRELEPYKNTTMVEEEKAFLTLFNQLDVGLMVEVTRALDQLFYKELHALVVFFEQERLRIASALFTVQHVDEF